MGLEDMQSDSESGYDLVRAKRAHMHVPAVGVLHIIKSKARG